MCNKCNRRNNRNRGFYFNDIEVESLVKILENAEWAGQITINVAISNGDLPSQKTGEAFKYLAESLKKLISDQYDTQIKALKVIDETYKEHEDRQPNEKARAEVRQMQKYKLN